MEKLFISVVMPFYNTDEKFFKFCLDSVLAQTYRNFELIIVDDGSKPESAELLDSLCRDRENIKVFHKKNSGVSDTRNFGTLQACGDYIMYVDSDDYLAPYALQQGVSALENNPCDFVFSGLQRIKSPSEFRQVPDSTEIGQIFYTADQIDKVRKSFFTQKNPEYNNILGYGVVNRGPYCRLVKSEIAKKVLFDPKLSIGEDVEWNMRVLNACSTVLFVKSVWYGYVIYSSSSIHKYSSDRFQRLTDYQIKLYENNKEYCMKDMDSYIDNLSVSFYKLVALNYNSSSCSLSMKEKKQAVKKVLSVYPWTLLNEKKYTDKLSFKHRLFIGLCSINMEFVLLKIRGSK